MAEEKVSSDTESSENPDSDDPETPQNEANDYEKQRESRIAENKVRMEAFGLHKIANTLMDLSRKSGKRKAQQPKSKRGAKKTKEDDDYEPNDDEEVQNNDTSLDSSSEESQGKKKKKKKSNAKTSGSQKVKKRNMRSGKKISSQKQLDKAELVDEDEAMKQAIALSLKDFGETSDLVHAGSSQGSKEATSNEKRRKKTFKSNVQMTEDDLVIKFCQFDEVGKGSIMLTDVRRMAASHDFTWTDKELADMIRCFDSDRDGKLSLDDFRNIVQRCNMLQLSENT